MKQVPFRPAWLRTVMARLLTYELIVGALVSTILAGILLRLLPVLARPTTGG